MKWLVDTQSRLIRLTDERQEHIETDHPEMSGQLDRIEDALLGPDRIVRSGTDHDVELFYRHYDTTPVTEKHLCVLVKSSMDDLFIITAYFTNTVKRGEVLWQKR